jgi:hypothetical protein
LEVSDRQLEPWDVVEHPDVFVAGSNQPLALSVEGLQVKIKKVDLIYQGELTIK